MFRHGGGHPAPSRLPRHPGPAGLRAGGRPARRLRRALVPVLGAEARWSFGYPILPVRRGAHLLGPLHLHRRDVFGLVTATTVLPEAAEIIVLPPVHPLEGASPTAGTGTEGTRPTLVALHGQDDASLRGYQQGDDLRRIHWPVTAHRGELMVRHEGQPTLRRAVIVLGGYAAPSSSDDCPSLDWMVEALGSVAVHLAGQGYALHVLTPDTLEAATAVLRLTPAQALRALAVVAPATGADPPRAPLMAAARELAGQGGVVVTAIGDHDEPMAHEVLSLKSGTTPGLLFVVDVASFAPSPAGSRAGRSQELAGLARSGGWRVAVVRRGDSVAAAWTELGASRGSGFGDDHGHPMDRGNALARRGPDGPGHDDLRLGADPALPRDPLGPDRRSADPHGAGQRRAGAQLVHPALAGGGCPDSVCGAGDRMAVPPAAVGPDRERGGHAVVRAALPGDRGRLG
ncbi:MAG: DUF58 domain-containing protein [Austwickia sp.]|nr:DUF58 domain-containing protein [Austwickia sp.]